jgi:hypothetical protein
MTNSIHRDFVFLFVELLLHVFFFLYLTNATNSINSSNPSSESDSELRFIKLSAIVHNRSCYANRGQQLSVKRQKRVVICGHLGSAVFPALRCVACVSMCAGPYCFLLIVFVSRLPRTKSSYAC